VRCLLPLFLLTACAGSKAQSGPAWNEPEPQQGYQPMDEPVTLSNTPAAPAGQVGQVDPAWTLCESDAQCIALETECCAYVAVNKAHVAEARSVLPYSTCDALCAVNVPARCQDGQCTIQAP
jgi:hypothetical protein